jgi:hypothetical protein
MYDGFCIFINVFSFIITAAVTILITVTINCWSWYRCPLLPIYIWKLENANIIPWSLLSLKKEKSLTLLMIINQRVKGICLGLSIGDNIVEKDTKHSMRTRVIVFLP